MQLYTTLRNTVKMPLLGLGVYDMLGKEAIQAVETALQIGYRLIDTASLYRNEEEVGEGIRLSAIPRGELFVTTKVGKADMGYEETLKAFDTSLRKLHIDYIDCYLLHWPLKEKRRDTWRALERLYLEKRVRCIGVANYLIPFLEELADYATEIPVIDQVEFSPYLFQPELLQYCQQRQIQLQSYTPLIRGQKMGDPRLTSLAAKHQKTAAQIILRWNLQLGVSTIPKSSNEKRLKENFDVFDFSLDDDDMKQLCSMNENFRIVDDPMQFL